MDKNAATSAFQNAIETHIPAFETFFLAKLFGARISYAAESCIVDIPVNDFMFNPQGSLHGGVIAFALDVSMGHLIHHVTKRAADPVHAPGGVGMRPLRGPLPEAGAHGEFPGIEHDRLGGQDSRSRDCYLADAKRVMT